MALVPHDLRLGARMLAKRPGTTALAVLTLAIGVGANTAAFSLLSFFLLRPLPYEAADRAVAISSVDRETGAETGVSEADLVAARETGAFSAVAAARVRPLLVEGAGEPEQISGADVTPDAGAALGVAPVLGRLFVEDDARADASVAVVGAGYWQRALGSDPSAIGRTIVVDRRPRTIVGVLPAGVQYPLRRVDVWLPVPLDAADRADRTATAVARLAEGVSVEEARAALDALATRLAGEHPETNAHAAFRADRLDELAVGKIKSRMLLLQLVVLFVLLIACANVANVRLALAAARNREVAIRAALGASRWRVARQFLVESLLLALAGGALGVLVAAWLLRVLVAAAPDCVVGLELAGLDARTLLFALATSLGAGLVFGLLPAIRASGADPAEALRTGSGASAPGFGRDRARRALLVVEIALTVMLLVGAGLVSRAYMRLEGVAPGFDATSGVAVDVALPVALAPDDARVERFYRDAVARVRTVPGVEAAGAVDIMPLVGWNPGTGYTTEGQDPSAARTRADLQPVTPEYFRAMGIPVLAGRALGEDELERHEPVAVVNARFARTAWPEAEAVGRRVLLSGGEDREGGRWLTVVGVVGDVRQFGVQEEPRAEIYVLETRRTMTVVARTSGDAAGLAPTIAAAVRSAEPGLPRLSARTLEGVVDDALSVKRLSAIVIGTLAGAGLLLGAMGLFGVVSHATARRTREIGVRMALGARRSDVARLVLGQCLGLTAAGLGLGLVGSLGLAKALRAYLFGMSALDPVAFGGACVVLAAVALLAAWQPVRAATRVDPVVALRDE